MHNNTPDSPVTESRPLSEEEVQEKYLRDMGQTPEAKLVIANGTIKTLRRELHALQQEIEADLVSHDKDALVFHAQQAVIDARKEVKKMQLVLKEKDERLANNADLMGRLSKEIHVLKMEQVRSKLN